MHYLLSNLIIYKSFLSRQSPQGFNMVADALKAVSGNVQHAFITPVPLGPGNGKMLYSHHIIRLPV